jgi:uncharacterized membrane protein YraQ (UPF0718 family)
MAEQTRKRGHGNWWFLAAVLGGYAVLSVMDAQAALQALSFFGRVMKQVLPVLGLVFVLLLLSDLILDEKRIRHYLGQHSGLKGWLTALFGGVLSVGPIYAWFAMLAEMRHKGMRDALIAAFLYSRAVKLPLLPIMVHYFGVAYTLVLSFYMLLFAIISGIVVERLTAKKRPLRR